MMRAVLLTSILIAATSSSDLGLKGSCQNGGVYIEEKCECTLAYRGPRCEEKLCLNGGRPAKKGDDVVCECPYEIEGDRCEKITRCQHGQLKNGACVCDRGFTGLYCEYKPCDHGVPAAVPSDEVQCTCDRGWTGFFCKERIICQNGGMVNDANECSCATGYSGPRCEACSRGFVKSNRKCIEEIPEASLAHTGSFIEESNTWSFIIIACIAALVVVTVVVMAVVFTRKCRTKSSRVPSAQGSPVAGTDV